jgi:hypothetical protein
MRNRDHLVGLLGHLPQILLATHRNSHLYHHLRTIHMRITLTIQTCDRPRFDAAVKVALKGSSPLIDWGKPLGNGSGFAPVHIVCEGYTEGELGFKIGQEYGK